MSLNRSRQYRNAIFYRNATQKTLAEVSLKARADELGVNVSDVSTEIVPVGHFTYAEAYHQKYYLTQYQAIRDFLTKTYSEGKALADSTVATRLNAYLGTGLEKDWEALVKELPAYRLPEAIEKSVRKIAHSKSNRS